MSAAGFRFIDTYALLRVVIFESYGHKLEIKDNFFPLVTTLRGAIFFELR